MFPSFYSTGGGGGGGGSGGLNGPRGHTAGLLPEGLIWTYIVQLSSALRAIHTAGLACRVMDPTKILSLSFFEDEAAIERWRTLAAHRSAQAKGRGGIFDDYRLRIASVIRDYGMNERAEAPEDSRASHG